MNSETRDRWVNIAMQYGYLESIYTITRTWNPSVKWVIRCMFTILAVILFFPVYGIRMIKMKNKECAISVYSGQRCNKIIMYLPNIHMHGFLITGDYIQMMIFTRKALYEIDLLENVKKRIIKPNLVIVDIGANIGNHSIYFSKSCSAKRVYSFEPIQSTFDVLCKNLELNRCENVEAYNIALGEKETLCSIKNADPNNIGGTQLEPDEKGSIITKDLDSFSLKEVSLIKIDVEGMEYDVLMGAKKTINTNRPYILIEIWPDNYTKVSHLLELYGYSLGFALPNDNYLFHIL